MDAMGFRFLHLADLHLETHHGGRPATRERLREATLEAFEAGLRLAREEALDAVLLAGDLFDDGLLSLRTELRLVQALRGLVADGISVLYASGNHDPSGAGWRAARLGLERVRSSGTLERPTLAWFADAEPFTLRVPGREGDALVSGAGHATDRIADNLAASFPVAAGEDLPHVGLLHTQVEGARSAERHDRFAPCREEDLAARRYDYWALGHVHQRGRVCERVPAWYSGNLQGRNPRESGPKGGLVVDLRRERPAEPRFVSLAPVRWETCPLPDLAELTTVEDLFHAVVREVEQLRRGMPGELALRVPLAGPCPLAATLLDDDEREALEEELAQRTSLLELQLRPDGLTRPRDRARLEAAPTVLAEALALLAECEHDDGALERVAPLELAGLSAAQRQDPRARRAYLRDLTRGLDEDLLERALAPQPPAGRPAHGLLED